MFPIPSSAEAILSYFLPNLDSRSHDQRAGLSDQVLTDRVAANVDSGVHNCALQMKMALERWGYIPDR